MTGLDNICSSNGLSNLILFSTIMMQKDAFPLILTYYVQIKINCKFETNEKLYCIFSPWPDQSPTSVL